MHTVPISKITVLREERQRRELKDLEELAESIKRHADALPDTGGLIHPIVITRDNVLVAGERRLTACRDLLGHTTISVTYADELSKSSLRSIELEENIKRQDLSWQEQCRALEEYHAIRKAEDEAWTQEDTADAIGLHRRYVGQVLAVARELDNPKIATAPQFSVAKGIVARATERRKDAAIEALRTDIAAPLDPLAIVEGNFNVWAPQYDGPRFNFIHCDFPYGIGADGFDQGSSDAHGGYLDTPEVYWELCRTLVENTKTLASDSAHLVFWFSMKHYPATLEFFAKTSDWVIDPFPLVWFKTDGGILPDPKRGPRRCYETALLGTRGDRNIVAPVANCYAAPLVRDRHMSEKPEPMLRHFFRMLVDEHTTMLDPTAGSGSAIRAARSLKAHTAFGLELNPEYVKLANQALKGG